MSRLFGVGLLTLLFGVMLGASSCSDSAPTGSVGTGGGQATGGKGSLGGSSGSGGTSVGQGGTAGTTVSTATGGSGGMQGTGGTAPSTGGRDGGLLGGSTGVSDGSAGTTTAGGAVASGGSSGSGGTGGVVPSTGAPMKPRVFALTDISDWETDDWESMTRFIVHADMYEIEGLIHTTGFTLDNLNNAKNAGYISLINRLVDAYEKDLPNLLKRSNQVGHVADETRQPIGYWPSAKYLRDRILVGSKERGVAKLSATNNSPGSDAIVKAVDEADDRPVWLTVWGGGNTGAQAIWKVKQERTAEELKAFIQKLRVYAITDQDRAWPGSPGAVGTQGFDYSSHLWMRKLSPGALLFIWDECAWRFQNDHGASNWGQYSTNIQGHGNLGSQYPKYAYGVEGDTPSFLYVTPTGLNDPDFPNQASWGGTFYLDADNLWKSDYKKGPCETYNSHFYAASFNNFAARMDWAKSGAGNRNPALVLDGDEGIRVLKNTSKQGTSVTLDASKSRDPDGDSLKFNWWVQADAGTYSGQVTITNNSTSIATVEVPPASAGKSFHVICEVTDSGTPTLTSYRRIIFEPTN